MRTVTSRYFFVNNNRLTAEARRTQRSAEKWIPCFRGELFG
jgi:hypothetical protein